MRTLNIGYFYSSCICVNNIQDLYFYTSVIFGYLTALFLHTFIDMRAQQIKKDKRLFNGLTKRSHEVRIDDDSWKKQNLNQFNVLILNNRISLLVLPEHMH